MSDTFQSLAGTPDPVYPPVASDAEQLRGQLLEHQIEAAKEPSSMSPTDAIFGFASWLTTRDVPLVVGAAHDAAPVAVLVDEYLTGHGLPGPSGDYPDNMAWLDR